MNTNDKINNTDQDANELTDLQKRAFNVIISNIDSKISEDITIDTDFAKKVSSILNLMMRCFLLQSFLQLRQ